MRVAKVDNSKYWDFRRPSSFMEHTANLGRPAFLFQYTLDWILFLFFVHSFTVLRRYIILNDETHAEKDLVFLFFRSCPACSGDWIDCRGGCRVDHRCRAIRAREESRRAVRYFTWNNIQYSIKLPRDVDMKFSQEMNCSWLSWLWSSD